jgi:hypothetical protein
MVKRGCLNLKDLFLNADAGFDDNKFRQHLESLFIEVNIDFNKRNGTKIGREEYFDEILTRKALHVMDGCIQRASYSL